MGARENPTDDLLRGGLRQLVVRLDLAQLLVVQGWVNQQLHLQRTRPSLRGPVRVPDDDDKLDFTGDPIELIGHVRRTIAALPGYRLLVLNKWVCQALDERLSRE